MTSPAIKAAYDSAHAGFKATVAAMKAVLVQELEDAANEGYVQADRFINAVDAGDIDSAKEALSALSGKPGFVGLVDAGLREFYPEHYREYVNPLITFDPVQPEAPSTPVAHVAELVPAEEPGKPAEEPKSAKSKRSRER